MHMVFVHVKSTIFSMHDFTKNIYRVLILFDASYVLFPMQCFHQVCMTPLSHLKKKKKENAFYCLGKTEYMYMYI